MDRTILFVSGAVIGIAALALGFFGGKTLQSSPKVPSPPKLQCTDTSQKCEVNVILNCDSSPCTLSVDHDPIVVNTQKQPIDLTWQLVDVTGKYHFEDTDIQIVGDDNNDFRCGATGGGKKFKCKDNNPGFAVYKYIIHATGPSGSAPVTTLDPWVVND